MRKVTVYLLIIGLMISASFICLGFAENTLPLSQSTIAPAEFSLENAVTNVAASAGKAVVSISTEYVHRLGQVKRFYFGFPQEDSPFGDEFFRRFFEGFPEGGREREYRQMGLGSGVIIDPEGYILTNEHVVSGAEKITVTLSDGREFKAEIKGKDARADLAIIKINAKDLPVAVLGDSDDLRIGQWVVAIGNPFAFALQNAEPTVTAGVISALHRSLGNSLQRGRYYNDLIQTDAAINPGNSGGPLTNLKGEIIGMNVAIFSTTGGYQGIGFAIPINVAKRNLKQLIQGKKILYGWLGVTVQDLDDKLAEYFGLSDKGGALVAAITENSPAQKSGMKKGDLIKRFNDKPVNNVKELIATVSNEEVGSKVKIVVLRDKKELRLNVEIGERPQDIEDETSTEEELPKDAALGEWQGMSVQDISPEIVKRFKLKDKKGVVVLEVESASAADEAGVIIGDIISEINRQEIKNLIDFKRVTRGIKGNALVMTQRGYLVIRGN